MKENGVVFPVCGRGGGTGWETEEKKCKQDGNVWRKWMKVRTEKEGGEGERKPHGARSYVKDTVMSPPLLMTPTSVTLFCLLCLGRSSQRPPPPLWHEGRSLNRPCPRFFLRLDGAASPDATVPLSNLRLGLCSRPGLPQNGGSCSL